MQAVAHQIANQSSFDHRNYGYATLSKLLIATDLFDVRGEGTGGVAVRDKRLAAPKKVSDPEGEEVTQPAAKKTAKKAARKPAKKTSAEEA